MNLPRPDIPPNTPSAPRKRALAPVTPDYDNPRAKRQLFPQWGLPRPVLNPVFNIQPTIAVRHDPPAIIARRRFRARALRDGHARRSLNFQNQEREE